jgi:hypothetical protein
MGKAKLFDEDSDNEGHEGIKTNEGYAKSYNEFRKKEILSHRKFVDVHIFFWSSTRHQLNFG